MRTYALVWRGCAPTRWRRKFLVLTGKRADEWGQQRVGAHTLSVRTYGKEVTILPVARGADARPCSADCLNRLGDWLS